jgi:hypothetical protein
MNLVCFSNNTAGALVCDLLNRKPLVFNGYKVDNIEHSLFKLGDTPTVQLHININDWNKLVNKYKDRTTWMGTHAHPTAIPDLTVFQSVIAITTTTRRSKLYRWLRYYNGWFLSNTPGWEETDELPKIDKIRELSKNVFVEFTADPRCINIEFEDIVTGVFVKQNNLNNDYFLNWQSANSWLYETNKSWAERRFDEAEWELQYGTPYKYT